MNRIMNDNTSNRIVMNIIGYYMLIVHVVRFRVFLFYGAHAACTSRSQSLNTKAVLCIRVYGSHNLQRYIQTVYTYKVYIYTYIYIYAVCYRNMFSDNRRQAGHRHRNHTLHYAVQESDSRCLQKTFIKMRSRFVEWKDIMRSVK